KGHTRLGSEERGENLTSDGFVFAALVGDGEEKWFAPEVIGAPCMLDERGNPEVRVLLDLVEDVAGGEIFLKGAMEETEVVARADDKETATFADARMEAFDLLRHLFGGPTLLLLLNTVPHRLQHIPLAGKAI